METPKFIVKTYKAQVFPSVQKLQLAISTHDGNVLTLHGGIHTVRHMKIHGTRTSYDGNSNYWNKRKKMNLNMRYM